MLVRAFAERAASSISSTPAAQGRVRRQLRERDSRLAQDSGEQRLHFAGEAARQDLEPLDFSRAEMLLALDRRSLPIVRQLLVLPLQIGELALEVSLDLELLETLFVDAGHGLPRLPKLGLAPSR